MESKSKDRRKHCGWRMLIEFKPEKPVKLQQIRDHFRHKYGVFLWQKKSPIGQIFRCRHYFNTNRRKSAVKCPYKIRWDKERGILWETGQHEHEHQTGGMMEQHNATQPVISKTALSRKAHYHNKIKSSITKKPGTTERKIKEKNRNPAKVTVICKGIEENCIANKHTVVKKQAPYIDNTGKEWQFLAKIEDEADLARVRLAYGLKIWFYEDNKIRLRCPRIATLPCCPYRGIYVKAERTLYYRGMHYHGEKSKKKNVNRNTVLERVEEDAIGQDITVAEQPIKRKNQHSENKTHWNDPFDPDDDDEYIFNLVEQIERREEADICEAIQSDNEETDEENAGVVKSRSRMKPKMEIKKKPNQANIPYIVNSGNKWQFLANIEDEVDFARIRKAHGLKIWFYMTRSNIRLRCSRYATFPSCTYRGTYMKAERTLYYRGVHYHDKNFLRTRKKVKRDIVTKKAEKDAMIGNNSMDTIVTGRPIEKRNEIIVADQSKARIKKYGTGSSEENWEFLAEVEDEVQLDQVRKINGLGKWKQNDNTTWLRCTRKSTFQSCPYRGVYVKADRILYHRGAHTTTMRRELEGTVSEQTLKEGTDEDTVAKHPPKIYIDKFGNQWKLLAKFEDDEHFNRFRLSRGLKLNGYSKTTFHLHCSSQFKKCRKCPYRGMYLVGPRLLYHRFAHNHPKVKNIARKVGNGPKMTKKKHNSRVDQQKPRTAAEGAIIFKDQRSEGEDDQRSVCQKRKTSSPVPDCPHSKFSIFENDHNGDGENDDDNQTQFVLADFEDEFKRASERHCATFTLAKTDLATKSVGKMLLFMDRGNSLVEVCKFEGDQFTGQREKWAITEPEQFRHEFHRICAEYLI